MTDPPQHWALVAGDASRTSEPALDHAIWSIVVKEKSSSFAEANHTKIAFPITDRPSKFPRSRLVEIGLPKPVIAVIEDAQPYKRLPKLHGMTLPGSSEPYRTLTSIAYCTSSA